MTTSTSVPKMDRPAINSAMLKIAILFHMGEPNSQQVFDSVTIDPMIEGPVRAMIRDGLVALKTGPHGDYYAPTPGGKNYINAVRDMFDRVLDLEIFTRVYMGQTLPADLVDANGAINEACHDDRLFTKEFAAAHPEFQTVDIRLWLLIDHLNVQFAPHQILICPHLIVFTQRLLDNEFASPLSLWTGLQTGHIYLEIDEIVRTAFRLDPASTPNVPEYTPAYWFEAGMRELTKRRGSHCGHPDCQRPLGIVEAERRAQKLPPLDQCPYCAASFSPPPPPPQPIYVEHCPSCQHGVQPHHRYCHSCHLKLDRSLAEGTVVTRAKTTLHTTEHTELYPTTTLVIQDPLANQLWLETDYCPPRVVYYDPNPCLSLAVWAALAVALY